MHRPSALPDAARSSSRGATSAKLLTTTGHVAARASSSTSHAVPTSAVPVGASTTTGLPCCGSQVQRGTPVTYPSMRRARSVHAAATAPGISLFPSGAKQASVVLPAVLLHVQADQVMAQDGAEQLEQISKAVKAGATGVVLAEGSSGAGASALYEAAVKLKALLTQRAALLVVDRLDIAQAAEADGVLLTDTGVPTVVAKRMLATTGGGLVGRITASADAAVQAAADGANLVLITASDQGPPDAAAVAATRTQQRSGNAIPVLISAANTTADASQRLSAAWSGDRTCDGLALGLKLMSAAAGVASGSHTDNGAMALDAAVALVAMRLKQQAQSSADTPRKSSKKSSSSSNTAAAGATAAGPTAAVADASAVTTQTSSATAPPSQAEAQLIADAAAAAATPVLEVDTPAAAAAAAAAAVPAAPPKPSTTTPSKAPSKKTSKRSKTAMPAGDRGWARRLVEGSDSDALLQAEKVSLTRILAFLEEVVPDLPELVLLRDAVKQLDEPFLVVVVGEFNSGKSSVINALLGKKFLAEGILPTTNEISVLRFSDERDAEQRVERQADGLYVRYLPSRLLEEMQIVDTPGTNVILERQQRLTEEYVPRADLVLFVMSADRPFSESEVRFLEYIRQWKKKVVFVVNKADMLESQDEVDQVKSFVADNARRVLRLDDPPVIAVSSRAAMRAKQAAAWQPSDSAVVEYDESMLQDSRDWRISGFGTFERIIYAFLIGQEGLPSGTVEGAGEGVRLKLQTPLFVADALVGAVGKKLEAEIRAAKTELTAVRAISGQLRAFKADMEKDATAQRDALLKVLSNVTGRMDSYIDRTLALSNVVQLVDYLAGPKSAAAMATSLAKFEAEAVGGAFDRVRDAVVEHAGWLDANCGAQLSYYRGFVLQRVEEAQAQGRRLSEVEAALETLPAPRGNPPASSALVASTSANLANAATADTLALAANAGNFDLMAATSLLEDEMRDAVVGTASTALGAPAVGLLITSWIDNAIEDLLVLGVAGAAAYASVINLPLRRAEIKRKVTKLAAEFVEGVQGRMKEQLDEQLEATLAQIEQLVVPLEAAAEAEVERVQALEDTRQQLAAELQTLSQRAANL